MGKITTTDNSIFETIKKMNEYGEECWYARDLQKGLGYEKWDNFLEVVKKAKIACEMSGGVLLEHFADVGKTIDLPNSAKRVIDDIELSRYACYLIAMNGDSTKEAISYAQTYFAIQTHRQEILDNQNEDEKRLLLRREMAKHNKNLASAAKKAGVETPLDYAIFQDYGYKGLYGGLGAKDIHRRKGLKKSQVILDHMNSTELAANLFRATQTEEKIRKEGIKGKDMANDVHQDVGRKVRQTIKEIGGTMPEDLPVVESIKKIERQQQKQIEQENVEDTNEA